MASRVQTPSASGEALGFEADDLRPTKPGLPNEPPVEVDEGHTYA
jgi:hypothetical protein